MRAAGPVPDVVLVTDGSCLGNPGPGGYAALLQCACADRVLTGSDPATTNNRMELQAVLKGLWALKRPCRVRLVADSQLVAKGLTDCVARWEQTGRRTTKRIPVENRDIWDALASTRTSHVLTVQQVHGHARHRLNERVNTRPPGPRRSVAARKAADAPPTLGSG